MRLNRDISFHNGPEFMSLMRSIMMYDPPGVARTL